MLSGDIVIFLKKLYLIQNSKSCFYELDYGIQFDNCYVLKKYLREGSLLLILLRKKKLLLIKLYYFCDHIL